MPEEHLYVFYRVVGVEPRGNSAIIDRTKQTDSRNNQGRKKAGALAHSQLKHNSAVGDIH